MSSRDTCRECGKNIPGDSPGGFCAQCLLGLGLEASATSRKTGAEAEVGALLKESQSEPGSGSQIAGPQSTVVVAIPPLTEKSGDKIGRYRLLQEIGRGGCGVVYMAEQEEPVRRRVALKVIKLGMDTKQVVARFEAERQALAMMDHPNIAKVLDAGAAESGRPYFVMELVRGIRITDYCDQNKLTTGERLKLFAQVCQAIQHAHQKGIIHRDIKPSNILVTLHDGVPVPKVIDFGIAKATQGRLTDHTLFTALEQFIGTPAYMSPEQVEMSGLDIDTRSDIYSLGVLLYELLVGTTPFAPAELLSAGLDEMRRTIREQEPVCPSTRLATMLAGELTTTAQRRQTEAPKLIHLVRGDLDWIVMKCLEKDRTRRYETANGLALDVQRHLSNEPVLARPASNAYKLRKAWRRNKLIFSAAAAVAGSLVLGLGVSLWQEVVATRAKNDAFQARSKAVVAQKQAEESQQAIRRRAYAADINLAYQSWEIGDAERTRTLLENQIPQAGEEDLRGWEWRYLSGRSRPQELATLNLWPNHAVSIAYSPDGKTFATHGTDRSVLRIWDAASRQPLATLSNDLHQPFGYSVACSRDGKYLLSTHYAEHLILLWDVDERRLEGSFTNHQLGVFSAAFTPDSRYVVSTGGNLYTTSGSGELKLWDRSTFREIGEFKSTDFPILRCDVSPDGRLVAASGGARIVQLWDLQSRALIARLAGHEIKSNGDVLGLRFSPDGQFLATGDFGGTVRLWNVGTNRADWATNEAIVLGSHRQPIYSLAFSPDGRRLASASRDHTAKLWDIPNQKELATLRGHAGRLWDVAFSSDGHTLATAAHDSTVKFWSMDVASEGDMSTQSGGQGKVDYSRDGRFLAWQDPSRQVITIWDLAKSNATQQISGGSFAFSPASNRIAVASPSGQLGVWSLDPLTEVSGPREMTLDDGNSNHLFQVAVNEVAGPQEGTFACPAFSPRGDRLAAIRPGGDIHIWTVEGWKKISTIKAQAGWVLFALDGESVLSEKKSGEITLWRIATGQSIGAFKAHAFDVWPAGISPDRRLLITPNNDSVRLWDIATQREIAQFKGGAGGVTSLAFSADAKTVAFGTFDGAIQLWNVASRQQAATLHGHLSFAASVAFSPDGTGLASSGMDNTLRLWKAPTWEDIARTAPTAR